MKKNIILTIIVTIILVLVAYLGYFYGKKSEQLITVEDNRIDSSVKIKQIVDPQKIEECSVLSTSDAVENCKTMFAIKQVKQTPNTEICKVLSGENREGCIFVATIGNAAKKQKLELCNDLPDIHHESCKNQAILKIIETDPNEKWCERMDKDSPEGLICADQVELWKNRKKASKLME